MSNVRVSDNGHIDINDVLQNPQVRAFVQMCAAGIDNSGNKYRLYIDAVDGEIQTTYGIDRMLENYELLYSHDCVKSLLGPSVARELICYGIEVAVNDINERMAVAA